MKSEYKILAIAFLAVFVVSSSNILCNEELYKVGITSLDKPKNLPIVCYMNDLLPPEDPPSQGFSPQAHSGNTYASNVSGTASDVRAFEVVSPSPSPAA